MEFLEITQRYFNRYINASELLESLRKINAGNPHSHEEAPISKLIAEIEKVIVATSDDKDELVNEEVAQLESTIERIEKIKQKNPSLPKEIENFLERLYKKRKATRDNAERWTKICNIINSDNYYQKKLGSLSYLELLELISKDMCPAHPIAISENKFNALVHVGIDHDKREWLWRLAFNYLREPYDINPVAKYYLDIDDCYYLTELISIAGSNLDIGTIIKEVSNKTPEFIEKFIKAKPIMQEHIAEDQFKDLEFKRG